MIQRKAESPCYPSLSTILLWHFLLDLQAAQKRAERGTLSSSIDGQEESLVFARIVGSISATFGPQDCGIDEFIEEDATDGAD